MRGMQSVLRWSEVVGWRVGVLACIALVFSAIGYLARTGVNEASLIGFSLVSVMALQLGAWIRACYLRLQGYSFPELDRAGLSGMDDIYGGKPLSFSCVLFDILNAHPLLGIVQPFFGALLGLSFAIAGVGQLISGPGLTHLIGVGQLFGGWLLFAVCYSAFLFRVGKTPRELLQMVLDAIERWRRRK